MPSMPALQTQDGRLYQLGRWRVDVQTNSIHLGDREVILEPKVMRLLGYFCSRPGETLSKQILLENVWGGVHFADSVVTRAISMLRAALEDDPSDPQYIRTVARRGYQLIAAVQPLDDSAWTSGATDASGPLSPVTQDRRSRHASASASVTRRATGLATALAVATVLLLIWIWHGSPPRRSETALPATPIEGSIHAIAVTPFRQITSDAGYRYLADSLHHDIAMQLARHEWPRIYSIPASQIADQSGLTAARAISADALLSGTFEASDSLLSITLTLQNPVTAELLWTADYAGSIDQTFAIRQEIIRALVALTRTGIEQVEQGSHAASRVHPEAYQRYLKARWHWRLRSPEDLRLAHQLFVEVTELDPEFADGFAALALSHITRVNYLNSDRQTSYQQADAAANRALELDARNGEALTARAQVQYQRDWNFAAAVADLEQAIRVSPGAVDARQYLAEIQSVLGLHQQAIETIDSALLRRPYSALLYGVKGLILNAAGRYDQVGPVLDRVTEFEGKFIWHDHHRAQALERMGRTVEASLVRLSAYRWQFDEPAYQAMIEAIEQTQGQAFWVWQLEQYQPEPIGSDALSATRYAEAQAANGREDQAVEWLARAMADRGEAFLMTRMSPKFDPLRERDDYRQLLDQYGVPVYAPESR